MVHSRKMNREVAEAFAIDELAGDKRCCLAFVGEAEPIYGAELQSYVASIMPKANVRFVGRASDDLYNLYLGAADVAVQLRTESRGETSKAVLDAMAHGLAVIVSDIGAASELPGDAVVKVPVSVTAKDLAAHLIRLRRDDTFRQALGAKAKTLIAGVYNPHVVGQDIHALIERYATTSARVDERALVAAIGDLRTYRPPGEDDLDWVASRIDTLFPAPRLRQILFDVSAIAEKDLRTGIERVVRAVLERLIVAPPSGYRVEPVVIKDGAPVYARAFVENVLDLPMGGLQAEHVVFAPGDHYLVVDWIPNQLLDAKVWIDCFRRQGGILTVVVHDLLPLEQPAYFPPWLHDVTKRWVDFFARYADTIACVSQSVAQSVERWTADARADRRDPLSIGFFHLGSDIAASRPTAGLPPDAEMVLAAVRERPTFLILGTVEPRKGHNQLIAAFEQLWDAGLDIGLIVVGKEGWMVDATSSAIWNSSAFGSKLHWLSSASDEFLGKIFGASTALVIASFGEGFGLPLIEAARHNKPIIARDLPVFREVAGDHAFYFTGDEPTDLAMAVRGWLDLRSRNCLPDPSRIRSLDWAESTEQLLALMFAGSNRHDPRSTGQAALSVVS